MVDILISLWWLPGFGILTLALYRFHLQSQQAEKKLQETQYQHAKSQSEITLLQSKINDLKDVVAQKDLMVENLNREINVEKQNQFDSQRTLDELRAKVRMLQDTLGQVNTEYSDLKKQHAKIQDTLSKEKDVRETSSALSLHSLEQFQNKIVALQKIIRQQNDAIALLHQKRAGSEQQITALKAQVEQKEEALANAEAVVSKRELELASAFASGGMSDVELRHALVELEYSLKVMEQQLRVESAAKINAQNEIRSLKEKNESSMATLQQIIETQNQELDALRKSAEEGQAMKGRVTELEQQLSSSLSDLEQERSDFAQNTDIGQLQDASVRTYEATVRSVVRKAPIASILLNGDGTIMSVNEQMCDLHKAPEEEIVGNHFSMFFGEDEQEFLKEQWDTLENKEDYFHGNIRLMTAKHEHHQVYFTLTALTNPIKQKYYVAFLLNSAR